MKPGLFAVALSLGPAVAGDAQRMHTGPAELTAARYYQPWTPIQSSVRPYHVAHELVLPAAAVDRIAELEKGGRVWITGDEAMTLGGTDEPTVTLSETGQWSWVGEEGRCTAREVYFHDEAGLVICDREVAFFNDVWRVYVDAEALLDDVGRLGLLTINDFDRDLGLIPVDADGQLDRSRPGYVLHLGTLRGTDAPSDKSPAELYVARLRFEGPRTPWPQTARPPRGLTTGVPPVTPYRYNLDATGFGYGALLRTQRAGAFSAQGLDARDGLGLVEPWGEGQPQPLAAKSLGGPLALLDPGLRVTHSTDRRLAELELARTQQLFRMGFRSGLAEFGGYGVGSAFEVGRANERWQVGYGLLLASPEEGVGWDCRVGVGFADVEFYPMYASARLERHFEVSSFSSTVRTVGFTAEGLAYLELGYLWQVGIVVHQLKRRMTLETEGDLAD